MHSSRCFFCLVCRPVQYQRHYHQGCCDWVNCRRDLRRDVVYLSFDEQGQARSHLRSAEGKVWKLRIWLYGTLLSSRYRQAAQSGVDAPYGNSSVLESTTNIPFNPRTSDSELPLTANFNAESSYQQWDSQGRAVGYSGDPTLYAPQPRKLANIPSGGAVSQGSSTGTSPAPYMSERDGYRAQPLRQNTSDSTASWDVQGQLGGPNSYPMSRSQYDPPYSGAGESRPIPPLQPPPMRSVGASPVTPTTTGNAPGSEQTPTQARFVGAGLPAGMASPHTAPLPHVYGQFAPPPGPPPPSAPAYAGSRSMTPDDPYAAYTQAGIR